MAGKIWFGTREYMQLIDAPSINMGMSKVGWGASANYLNGGAYVRTSNTAHKEYDLAWNPTAREEIEKVLNYADGIYGSGPIYWADPFNMDRNILPSYWAAPFMGITDGPNLLTSTSARPTAIGTTANSLGYPTTSAVYTLSTATPKTEIWMPIPPGYTLWIGVHGSATSGGGVRYVTTNGNADSGSPIAATMLAVTSTDRVVDAFQNNGGVINGVRMYLHSAGTLTLAGIIAQLLPTGATPLPGGFISGQGHSGCSFASQPLVTGYSAAMDRVGATAKLIETQAWQ